MSAPFYYDWRFLLALILAAVLFLCLVVAVLCWTSRNQRSKCEFRVKAHTQCVDQSKRTSIDSLQLADGAVVNYELKPQHRPAKAQISWPFHQQSAQQVQVVNGRQRYMDPPRPNPLRSNQLDDYDDDRHSGHYDRAMVGIG